jgi:hypothetical protein
VESFTESVDRLGAVVAQVARLADVCVEVVQFDVVVLEELDELPAARPDGRRRRAVLVPVVRVVPEERVSVEATVAPP